VNAGAPELIYLLGALFRPGWLGVEPAPCTCPGGRFWFTKHRLLQRCLLLCRQVGTGLRLAGGHVLALRRRSGLAGLISLALRPAGGRVLALRRRWCRARRLKPAHQ
jgi:hypothetical protein